MTVSPETLLAFVEGELSPEEAKKVAAEVANDSSLAAHVENHRALKERLQAAALPSEAVATSESAEPMLLAAPVSQRFPAATAPRRTASYVPAGAMAAGIVLGALLWGSMAPAGDIRVEEGMVIADGTLARALSIVTAKDRNGPAFSPSVIGDSFFSNDGFFCRNFGTGQAGKGGLAGIACREDDQWRIRLLASADATANSASAKEPPVPQAVRDMLETLMVGTPLDPDSEQAARAQHWLVQ